MISNNWIQTKYESLYSYQNNYNNTNKMIHSQYIKAIQAIM